MVKRLLTLLKISLLLICMNVWADGVAEALRAKVPATELLVAAKIDIDERVSEALRLAKNTGLKVNEYPRAKLDAIVKSTNF